MKVFFYGLFMDEDLLVSRGIEPGSVSTGFVDDYELLIGKRATLARRVGSRVYGLMMEIARGEVTDLYAEDSVADYIPEPVVVVLTDGSTAKASCYNLPADKVTGTNRDYAKSLLDLATRLGFPASYLDQISRAGA